jgi:alkanesulfonate monooxygenase SsuD/methylene tetrahydromethanopterin reductase-like flavin-dependent oxidoreductase (luciferase family)
MIERAQTAHAAGFSSLSIGDHHVMTVPYAQNTPMLGRLLAEWSPDRPAGCLFLMPLWHPVLMAEHIGTLAAIHGGTFIVQTGIGNGDAQFQAMGADLSTRGRVIEAMIPAVKALLNGETVDDPVLGLTGGRIGLTPPGPVEWWIGAGADAGVDRAARLGDAWYAGLNFTPAEGRELADRFRSRGGRRIVLRKDALVLADGDRARSVATELVEAGYRGLAMEHLIVGNPDDAAEQLAAYTAAGFDEVNIRCMAVPQDLALETLALLGPVGSGPGSA